MLRASAGASGPGVAVKPPRRGRAVSEARRTTAPLWHDAAMSNHVYRLTEVVGSSQTSVDDAIRTAVRKASETVRNIEWFQTQEIRGQVVDGDVAHFQVTMKLGFRVEE
jgi:dodecin